MSVGTARPAPGRDRLQAALAVDTDGDPAGALACYDDHLALVPGDVDAWRLSVCALRALGRADEAEVRLRRATELPPLDAEAWASLGHVVAERGDPAAALACFTRALGLAPTHVEALYGRANAARRLVRAGEAPTDYARVLALAPDHGRARHNLGDLLGATGDSAQGRACLRAVAAVHRSWTEPRYNLALAHLAAGEFGLGFRDDALRWALPGFPSPRRHAEFAAWDGQALRRRAADRRCGLARQSRLAG